MPGKEFGNPRAEGPPHDVEENPSLDHPGAVSDAVEAKSSTRTIRGWKVSIHLFNIIFQ